MSEIPQETQVGSGQSKMQIFKEYTPEIAYWCTEVLSIFPTFDVDIHQSVLNQTVCDGKYKGIKT
jgi:hypothetical protein